MGEKTQAPLSKAEQLAADYAANRIELREIQEKIYGLLWPVNEDGLVIVQDGAKPLFERMQAHFKDWQSCDNDGAPYEYEQWVSWTDTADDFELDGDEMEIAKLWDERKKIRAVGGNLRRAICTHGRAILSHADILLEAAPEKDDD